MQDEKEIPKTSTMTLLYLTVNSGLMVWNNIYSEENHLKGVQDQE